MTGLVLRNDRVVVVADESSRREVVWRASCFVEEQSFRMTFVYSQQCLRSKPVIDIYFYFESVFTFCLCFVVDRQTGASQE